MMDKSTTLQEGQTIADNRFKVKEILSKEGGFGVTYLAFDNHYIHKPVCVLKQLINRPLRDEMSRRLDNESKALEKLDHSQIPKFRGRIYDGDHMYIAMEFIEGITLAKYIEENGRCEEDEILKFLREMLSVLNYIHKENVIHRDIKPNNIILRSKDDKPVLIDFGIIKEISGAATTVSTSPVITRGYSPLEQLVGRAKEVSDLFSLGRTAIHWLTGMSPLEIAERNKEDIYQKINWKNFASNDFNSEIARIIDKATAPVPEERYQSAAEMLDALLPSSPLRSDNNSAKDPALLPTILIQDPLLEEKKNISEEKKPLPYKRYKFKYAVLDDKEMLQEISGRARSFIVAINDEINLDMVFIHSGSFLTGVSRELRNTVSNEELQTEFCIGKFLLGKFSVTQEQWRTVASLPQIKRRLNPEPSFFKGDFLPVERVSWKDAIEFCRRLSSHTKINFRLPSEVEWEYACRAGSTTPYSCGRTIDERWANFFDSDREKGTRVEATTLYANKFGLYDMLGNVWEWCQNSWRDAAYPPTYQNTSGYKVRRGGSWQNGIKDCRCSRRSRAANSLRNSITGFRVAADIQ